MKEFEGLFLNRIRPGLYLMDLKLNVQLLSATAERHGFRFFYIDAQGVFDKSAFLSRSAAALKFSDYFGQNWDAFDECIRDLQWAPGQGYVIFYDHVQNFQQAHPDEFATGLKVLSDAIQFWHEIDIPMFVLLAIEQTSGDRLNLPKLSSFI